MTNEEIEFINLIRQSKEKYEKAKMLLNLGREDLEEQLVSPVNIP